MREMLFLKGNQQQGAIREKNDSLYLIMTKFTTQSGYRTSTPATASPSPSFPPSTTAYTSRPQKNAPFCPQQQPTRKGSSFDHIFLESNHNHNIISRIVKELFMASIHLPTASPRKKSKNDQLQISDQQDKINQMVHGFYEKMKAKIGRALTKCQNRNVILCKELFDSLSMHPKQELYETIKLHDLIFNEMDLISEVIAEFLRKMETLQDKLRDELMLQKQRSVVKKQKEGENHIAILRKVSFKKESTTFKSRLLALDTINKKLLKCEDDGKGKGHFGFEIEGKKSDIVAHSYGKIWFQSKRRDYLICYGNDKTKDQYFLFNDKLQKIASFGSNLSADSNSYFEQISHYVYLVSLHKITRLNLFMEQQTIVKVLPQVIVGVETKGNTLLVWCWDDSKHCMVISLNQTLNIIDQTYLKLNVTSVLDHFKLTDQRVYFLTKSYNEQVDLLEIDQGRCVLVAADIGAVVEVIPESGDNLVREAIFRLSSNKFLRFNGSTISPLQVEIDQSESLRCCAILGEYLFALSQNGKSMLQCHYQPHSQLSPE